MIKGLLPILYTSAGVTAAGVTGYVVLSPQFEDETMPAAIVQTVPEPETREVASLETKEEAAKPAIKEPEIPAPVPPAFTLLRVEKDGSTVIAGSAPLNSEVSLFDGENEIGKTSSGPTGDFAFVLDQPLSPGPHELHLTAKPKDSEAIASVEAGLINVPQPEADEEPTVLVSAAGEATRVLQKPEEPAQQIEEVVATASETVKLAEPGETEPEPKVATVADPVPEAKPEPQSVRPVLIEAADIEKGRIYIAGTGEPGADVSIYLENELLGTTPVGENGAFLFEGDKNIEPGRYSVRADMRDESEGKVVARAEVRLVHEPPVVAELPQPEPKPEPQPEEVVETVAQEAPVKEEAVAAVVEPEDDDIPEIRTGSTVIIRRGDNLWQVARRNYGSGIRYTTIFEANRDQVRDPDLIYPGQVLKVPENQQGTTDTSNG